MEALHLFDVTATPSSVNMCLHPSGRANGVEQSLQEEQERRTEAEEQVQLLKQKLSGEFCNSIWPPKFRLACRCSGLNNLM